MAHRSKELFENSIYTEREKFSASLEKIAETTRLMVSRKNELTNLRAEIASRMAELHALKIEINSMAVKYGLEPIPAKGIQLKFKKPGDVLVAMPLEALK